MNNFSNKFGFVSRWVLIAGVLLGLFFSSGEGIRLLPFPAMSVENDWSNTPFDDDTFKSYSPSVNNPVAQAGKNGAKVQKNLKFFDCADSPCSEPQTANFLRGIIVQNNLQATFFKNAAFSATPSDRAPPVL